jgi:hypothetical protein
MAYSSGNLTQLNTGNGYSTYRYDSLDAITLVDIAGYFNNSDDDLNLQVGDMILVVDWATAVRTGTITGWGWNIVMAVSAAGVVDLAESLAGVVTNTD